jgi:endonuclease/exonuclease/phosphatase family metal-dependent hydrolase
MQTPKRLRQRGETHRFSSRRAYSAFLAFCILHLAFCILGCRHLPRAVHLSAAPASLVIVTWNLHGPAGDLPRLVQDLRSGRLTAGVPVTAFVLLLQEGAPDISAFANREGLFARYEPVYSTRGNAILSTLPLLDPRTIELPRERQRRVAVAASIDLGGMRVRLATTHLENRVSWWRGGLFSEDARRRQAEALIAALPPDEPTILGGDFNAWLGRNEPAWRALASRFPDGPAPLATPTFRDRLFLDEIFFDVPDSWAAERVVVPSRYGSDHHPVIGLLRPR